jgi:hypothetical protein
LRGLFLLGLCGACAAQPSATPRTFDPCAAVAIAAPGASEDQAASVAAAIDLWHARDAVGLALGDPADPADVTIVFRAAAGALHGRYDGDGTVFINTDLADAHDRAIVIAHELGHAIGLVHVAPSVRASVMNPGNLTIGPTDADTGELVRLWGSCNP